jgi:heptosyltransferase-2
MTSPPEKLLVRGVNWLGDAVMSTPALQRLREARPNAHLTLLTPRKLADLWLHHPDVDAVQTFDAGESLFAIARRLREDNFGLALIFPNSPRSALEVFLARIPQRIGVARPWRNFLLTRVVPPRADERPTRKRSVREVESLVANPKPRAAFPPAAHHVHQYLHLVAVLGGANGTPTPPRLVVTDDEVEALAKRFGLSRASASGVHYFGLNPGAEYGPAKRWPRERFVAAAIELHRRTNCRWLVFGGRGDTDLANQITEDIRGGLAAAHKMPATEQPVLNLAGQTTLRELCAGLKLCSALLTNDSGPAHVAAALGTPVIVPFGSTAPELTGPGWPPTDSRHALLAGEAPCAPCFRRTCPIDLRCMTSISVERVVKEVLRVLSGVRPSSGAGTSARFQREGTL